MKTKEQKIIETEAAIKTQAERISSGLQEVVEALATWQAIVQEVRPTFGLGTMPPHWRIPAELKPFIVLPLDSDNNCLQRAIKKIDGICGLK